MIIVKCIKNVEKELEVINSELERESTKQEKNKEYIAELSKEKENLEEYLENYKKNLKELDEIETRIYYKIVYDGMNSMKAIEKVAEENYLTDKRPSNSNYIFRKIYPKIRKMIKSK